MADNNGRRYRWTSVSSITLLCLLAVGGVLYWHYATKTGNPVYIDFSPKVNLPGPVGPEDNLESHGVRRQVEEPSCVEVGPGEVPPLGRKACSVEYHFTPPGPVDKGLPGYEPLDVPGRARDAESNLRGKNCDKAQGCEEALPPAPALTEVCKDDQTECVTLDKGIVCIDGSLDCDILDDEEYRIQSCGGRACRPDEIKPCPTILPGKRINCKELKAMLAPALSRPGVKDRVQGVEIHKQQEHRDVAKHRKGEAPVYGPEFGLDVNAEAINKFASEREKGKKSDKGRKSLADEQTSKDAGFGLDLDLDKIQNYQRAKKVAKTPKVVKPAKVYKDLELDLDLAAIQKKLGKVPEVPKKVKDEHETTGHDREREEAAASRRVGDREGLAPRGPGSSYEPPGGHGRVVTMPGDEFNGRVEHGDMDLFD